MSTFRVVLVERLGAPDPAWPTIYGPAAPGSDPIAANSLHTLDLTASLAPVQDFDVTLERDLTKSSFGSLNLDLVDSDGTLADSLGPLSSTLAATNRYYGPWVQLWEDYGSPTTSVLRFLGYLDDATIEWEEERALTKATALHATQLLKERFLTDFQNLLRPYPVVPTTATQSFAATTADDALHAAASTYTPRANKLTVEQALWAAGKLTWYANIAQNRDCTMVGTRPICTTGNYQVPSLPSRTITIGSNSYVVDHVEWNGSISQSVGYGPVSPHDGDEYGTNTYEPLTIVLSGAPNLTSVLAVGTTVAWAVSEQTRTHYLLEADIPSPVSGSDGQRFLQLNTVEQLVPGDVLTFTYVNTTSGAQRLTTTDLPPIIDLDGETGKAWLYAPFTQAYAKASVSKVRRNSQDPVLFDGLAYAKAVAAPFTLDTTYFQPAKTFLPVLTWRNYDATSPQLYGSHGLQTMDGSGTLQLSRRGADNGGGAYTTAGVWQGNWDSGWAWKALPNASATHDVYGDALQWPGAAAPFKPPVIYTAADLSGGATIPKNGWRNPWRTWKGLTDQIQDIESYWNGTALQWASHTASGYIPASLVAFSATTASPGRYTRTSAPAWTFEALTADRTLAASSTPIITGTPATGNWFALGMGAYADATVGHLEALLSLSASTTTGPWTSVVATLMTVGASGALTVKQTPTLTIPTAGPWAIGGGLVCASWTETRGGASYARSRLFLVDGRTTPLQADLLTMEVIPGTIQPLQISGTGATAVLSGWRCLALETFTDSNYHQSRRLRFVVLKSDLTVANGELEPDPADPTNVAANFRRGDIVAEGVADGAIIARMVRTGTTTDAMTGQVGGRLFTADLQITPCIERLKIGATAQSSSPIGSVVGSGDGLTVMDYLDALAGAQIATALPNADGNMRLVSRGWGDLRWRSGVLSGYLVSIQDSERGKKAKTQAWQGFLRTVRVTYGDAATGQNLTYQSASSFDGGKVLDLDVSNVVWGVTAARAIGMAAANLFGNPQPILHETWVDRSDGAASGLTPPFFAGWQIGDLISLQSVTAGYLPATVTPYKILSMKPGLEDRSVDVQLLELPVQVPSNGSAP